MVYKIISVFIGGGLGAILRFVVSGFSKKYFMTSIFGTLFVNLLGCLLIGYVFGYILNKTELFPEVFKIFIVAGFLGGLTTFSTFNLEIFEFLRVGKIFQGLLYMFLSCVFGLFFTYVGYLASKIRF